MEVLPAPDGAVMMISFFINLAKILYWCKLTVNIYEIFENFRMLVKFATLNATP